MHTIRTLVLAALLATTCVIAVAAPAQAICPPNDCLHAAYAAGHEVLGTAQALTDCVLGEDCPGLV